MHHSARITGRIDDALLDEAHGDDEALLADVATGDRDALARLYRRHASTLLAVGQRILRNTREAEDLLHDVFLEVWRTAGSFDRRRGRARSWLTVKMRSRALDRLRSSHHPLRAVGDEHHDAAPEAPAEDPALAPDRAAARRAVSALPAELRVVLFLRFFEDLSCAEISARTAVPVSTVKLRAARAVAHLRSRLTHVR